MKYYYVKISYGWESRPTGGIMLNLLSAVPEIMSLEVERVG
jgi:hypothetical protein